MQDLNDMVTYARVFEARGFTETARRVGKSKSSINNSIATLEKSLGVRLLNRSTRGRSVTKIGVRITSIAFASSNRPRSQPTWRARGSRNRARIGSVPN